jgi:lambda family phage tail tape measure protein
MATDLAQIGFGVETSQLEKGISTLNTFSNSAKSANNSAKSVGTAMNGAAKVFAAAVAGMTKSIASLVSVTQGATTEQIKAANEAAEFADRVYRAAQAQDKLAASTQKVTAAIKGQYNAFLKAASNESVLNRINRITGVTGLTGLNAKESAMNIRHGKTAKEWAEAIGETPRDLMPNRFNTANIAAQFQDIGVTAAMGMNPLLIALQQGTQLSAVLNSMEKPIKGLADAFKQIINPTSLWTIALTALAVVGLQMVDWIGVAQSSLNGLASAMDFVASHSDSFGAVLTGLVGVIGVIKFESIKTGLSSVISVASKVFTTFTSWSKLVEVFNNIKKSIVELKVVTWALANPVKAVTAVILAGVTAWAAFSEAGRNALNKTIGYTLAAAYSIGGAMEAGFKSIYKGFDKAFGELSDQMKKIAGKDYIAAVEDTVSSVASGAAAKFREWSNGLNDVDKKIQKIKEAWKDLQNQMNQDIAGLQLDKKLIGVDTYTSEYMKTRADLMNQATNAGIPLTPDKIAYIDQAAQSTAGYREETEKLNDVFNTSKSITNSFFQDMRTGLRDGASAWEAFGNAALNALDNILSKMMDVGVDYLFNAMGAAGWFSGNSATFSTASGGFDYAGYDAAFNAGMADAGLFAKGGAFTNGVYNSPTLFKFANGGQFGVMGEAGPEAVMPLRRGPDGSLGVDAEGIGGNNVVVNVINNSNAQASVNQRETRQGTEIDVLIDQTVAQKMTQQGSYSNNALNAYSNRRLVMR